jgi:D-serine deaminase-like pyridoxal phosphate-dependent protein
MLNSFALEQIRAKPFAAVPLDRPLEIAELPTPALVLDRPAFERNLAKMADFLGAHAKGFRPHAKTHKCPLISQAQLAAGAVGVCAAKVSEAAALTNAGITRVLITSPLVTDAKAQVLNSLARDANEASPDGVHVVVDSEAGLDVLARNIDTDTRLGLVVDMDVAMGRTGTRDSELLLRLVDAIVQDPRFEFAGIQHYAGHVMHIADFEERKAKSLELWERLQAKIDCLDERGIEPAVVTGCGTGTYNIDVDVACVTDLQVGSYVFMDEQYCQIAGETDARFEDFEVSLTVACTAISQPSRRTITVDGGYKSFASETVSPVVRDVPGLEFRFAGDEHGVLILNEGQQEVRLGQVLQFVTPHCDPTVNLHDFYWVQESDGMVHSCWPIAARGCSW